MSDWDNVYGSGVNIEGIYTHNESWYNPKLWHLRKQMRKAVTHKFDRKKCMETAFKYSREKVGNEISRILHNN